MPLAPAAGSCRSPPNGRRRDDRLRRQERDELRRGRSRSRAAGAPRPLPCRPRRHPRGPTHARPRGHMPRRRTDPPLIRPSRKSTSRPTYDVGRAAITIETGGTNRGATPVRRRTMWIRHRPTRPFPSMNGWIVSNCACAIAAGPSAGGRPVRGTRRGRPGGRRLPGGGGTNSASSGLSSRPRASSGTADVSGRGRSRAISVAWMREVLDRDGAGSSARAIASSMALTFAATVRALPSAARGSTRALAG